MNYRDADDEYFAIVGKHGPALFSTVGKTTFPQTYRAMFGFCAKTNSLKTAMFDAIESNNPYAFKILFRCFCEHYLKFTYIFTRFLTEKTDTVGSEYYSFCGAVEARDYASAIAMAEDLVGNSVVANVEKAMAQLYPEAAKLSLRELENASNRFKYRAILRFLNRESLGFIAKERPFLAQIVPAYALLSSFVHGGPYTDMEMAGYSDPRAIQECENDMEIVFMMTASVFMLTVMAVSREHPAHAPIAAEVNSIIKRFVGELSDET